MAGPMTRNLTIMLTDIKDFTTQTSKRSRAEIALMLDRHKEIVLPVLQSKGGTLVKTIGDAFLVTFESPTDAVLAGIEVQDAIRRYNAQTRADQRFDIRVALNQGEVNLVDNDVFGDPVNIASRLEEIAEVGEVYFTDAVYLSMNKREVRAAEIGLMEFKGVPDKVRVYKVRRELPTSAALPFDRPAPAPPPSRPPAAGHGMAHEVNLKIDLPGPAPTASGRPQDTAKPEPRPAFTAAAPVPGATTQWTSGPSTMSSPEELIGKDVGPCRIEAIMGRGGMGVVYRGRHKSLDRLVAIKVITPSIHRASTAAELLLQEARLVARLEDPRIVQVYDVGTQGTLSFVVMQLITGETLGDLVMRKGLLSPKEALAVMAEVLRGLAAAHAKGIVHRDLKPSNIMIDRGGQVKLLDFGIAGVTGNEEFAPDATFSGTLDFMAPEQAFGSKADPRMDLYSFGATLYFTLTGMPPFVAKSPTEVMLKHREAPIPDVREINREASPALAALIQRLMQKFPEARPSGAAEVLKELEGAGMVVDGGVKGTPLKILPPPVEPKPGFAAELESKRNPALEKPPEPVPAPEPAAFSGAAPVLPDPPPPVDFASGKVPLTSWALFGALFYIFFGTAWRVLLRADWLAGGFSACVAAAVLAYTSSRSAAARIAGTALFAAACWCFYSFVGGGAGPALEVLVLAALGFILGGAGVFLGFLSDPPERELAAGLLAGGGLVLLLASAAGAAPAGAGFIDGLGSQLGQAAAALASSGGFFRWTGLAVAYGAYRFGKFFEYDPASWSRRKTSDGRIINWNK